MRPLSSTELKPLEFNPSVGETSRKMTIPTSKIGWLHTLADQPGAKFDIVIKDALGRVKYQRKGCGNDTEKHGELVNLPTHLGEELEVSIENLQGAKKLSVFIN